MLDFKIDIDTKASKDELNDFLTLSFSQFISSNGDVEIQDGQNLEQWFDIDGLLAYLDSKNGYLITARDESKKLIGISFIGKQSLLNWPDGNKAELFIIAVDINYRRFGIGTKLLQRAEECARNFDSRSIMLNTHIDQKQSRSFYEKNEYTLMGILHDYYDNGDAAFYGKSLI